MRLTSSIVKGTTWSVRPSMIHRKPSLMPRTSMPDNDARIVVEAMTLLIPGAGPPPARIAIFFGLFMSSLPDCPPSERPQRGASVCKRTLIMRDAHASIKRARRSHSPLLPLTGGLGDRLLPSVLELVARPPVGHFFVVRDLKAELEEESHVLDCAVPVPIRLDLIRRLVVIGRLEMFRPLFAEASGLPDHV